MPVNTNYVGNAYFGEYPLTFAAILNQPESLRLLIAHKADPNKQDFNGNTVLHLLVIYDNLEVNIFISLYIGGINRPNNFFSSIFYYNFLTFKFL